MASCPRPERIGSVRKPIRGRGQSCLLATAVVSPLPYPEAIGPSRCGGSGQGFGGDSTRRKCTTCPVGMQSGCLARLCPQKRRTGRYLGFVGETPIRQSPAARFGGRRPGRSSLVGKRLSMVFRTVQELLARIHTNPFAALVRFSPRWLR